MGSRGCGGVRTRTGGERRIIQWHWPPDAPSDKFRRICFLRRSMSRLTSVLYIIICTEATLIVILHNAAMSVYSSVRSVTHRLAVTMSDRLGFTLNVQTSKLSKLSAIVIPRQFFEFDLFTSKV